MKLYLVGGAVRNHLLGQPTKDYDFAVEAESYEAMRDGLVQRGLTIWQERPEYVTVRGQISLRSLGGFDGILPAGSEGAFNADFTLCRAEAQYSDQRHPDVVTPASLGVDLSRRDFTMNAIAVSEEGEWIDPYEGEADLANKMLVTVGRARNRFEEDPLRMLRAVRFAVKYRLRIVPDVMDAMNDPDVADGLRTLPHERVREELNKALIVNWRRTIVYLVFDAPVLGDNLFSCFPNLWMKATTEER